MSSQHADRDRPLTVRPPAAVRTAAQTLLTTRDLEMRGFITACLSALAADPDGFLAKLAEHWPADKPRGRPRRPTDDTSPRSTTPPTAS